jgi:regulator of sigma E protease
VNNKLIIEFFIMFTTIIVFVLVLSLLVFAHELGHFWVAKKFGLIPKEFGFGFPPRAFGIYKDKEGKWKKVRGSKEVEDAADTVYSINYVPIGGFVALGEDDEADNDPNHFNSKPAYQRAAILLAGVTMNIILAACLFSFGFMIGLPQTLGEMSPHARVSDIQVQVMDVMPGSPAAAAELQAGDMFLEIDGVEFASSEEVQGYINEHVGQELSFKINREGEVVEKMLTPEFREDTGRGGIGVGISERGIVSYPIHIAIWEGFKTTLILTWVIIVAFYELIKGIFMGQGVGSDLGGPVRIAEVTGNAARMGFAYLINFTALLSINLAIINAFPFPALDGGRILFLALEKIKGSPVRKEVEGTIHYIGFIILMILIVLVTYKDIARLF